MLHESIDTNRVLIPRYEALEAPPVSPSSIEFFERWVTAGSASRAPGWEELHSRIALYGPEDLSEMIEVVREAVRVCLAGLQDLNERMRSERRRVDAVEWRQPLSVLARVQAAEQLERRLNWLQMVHRCLAAELQRYEEAGVLGW